MLFERTEHEPEEYDPEADFRDPNSDSLTIPRVETTEADVPGEIQSAFWLIVLTLNAAILAGSIGVLLLAFEADATRGGALLVGGIVLAALAWRRYRSVRPTLESDSDETVVADGDPPNDAPDDGDDPRIASRDESSSATETDSTLESESDSPDPDSDSDPDPNRDPPTDP